VIWDWKWVRGCVWGYEIVGFLGAVEPGDCAVGNGSRFSGIAIVYASHDALCYSWPCGNILPKIGYAKIS